MNEDELREERDRHREGLLLTHHIQSARTARLLDEVWERIPEEDREVLRQSIRTTVVEGPGLSLYDPVGLLEAVSRLVGAVDVDGVETILPRRALALLDADVLSGCSDGAARAVIARELGHAVLRHPTQIYPLAVPDESGRDQDPLLQELARIHQWEADLQAWLWGFCEELSALWEASESDPPPWYHPTEKADEE